MFVLLGAFLVSNGHALAGKLTYERNCASCHGVNLEGAAVVPNLSGDAFAAKWSGAPVEDLATELRQMPPGNTAGLDERAYEELAAYLLAFNGIPAAPETAANTLRFRSDGVLPDITQGQQATMAVNIASGAAEVLERLTPCFSLPSRFLAGHRCHERFPAVAL